MIEQMVLVMMLSYHPVGGYEEKRVGNAKVVHPVPLERCVVWPARRNAITPSGTKWYWQWLCATKEGGWESWSSEPQRV